MTIAEPQTRQRERYSGRTASSLTPNEAAAAHAAGYEPGSDGSMVGRDPRRMSPDNLRAMGHEPMAATAAIRARCLDCCGGSPNEVRLCVATACPSWPWRMGTNPWRQPMSDEQREALRRSALERGFGGGRASVQPAPGDETDSEVG
jgi:hypothetical protein